MADPEGPTRVLVVTEDRYLADEAAYSFPSGVDVKIAGDAEEALALMEGWPPAVAVLDLRAGNAGGYALSREMDHDLRFSAIPRLVLLEREEDRWLAAGSGARAVRVKPIGSQDLARDALALLG